MKLRLLLLVILLSFNGYSQSIKKSVAIIDKNDPFIPYLTGKAPLIIKEMGEKIDSVRLRKVIFLSREVSVNGKSIPTQVFAAIARPLKPGNYPGLLILHGGDGSAEINKIKKWAARGYIAVSLDLPGITQPEKVPHSSGYWKSSSYAKNRFTASPDITYCTIFETVVAAVQGFYLLHSQADVIKQKIGISGVSWGGYSTTIVSGLVSPNVSASFSTYGSGFYDTGSVFLKELDKMTKVGREAWIKYLDAGRRAKYIAAPYFIAAATNDNWFYPPAVMATLNAVKAPVNHFFAPNANHGAAVPGGNGRGTANRAGSMLMEEPYFDFYLKGIGYPLPEIAIKKRTNRKELSEGNYVVTFSVKSRTKITDASISYSIGDTLWTKRKWTTLKATSLGRNLYTGQIPAADAGKKNYYFTSVSDDRPVTVSSNIIEYK